MRCSVAILLLSAVLGGCTSLDGKRFSVLFQPYSSDLDAQAQAAVQSASAFAQAHPLMPLSIAGYVVRIDPGDIDTLRQQRVMVVQDALVRRGVNQVRIEVLGNGILYPDGVPDQTVGRVDINIGL
jgi:outer membrane protein OmpA-like peptidoglycan-associated protein